MELAYKKRFWGGAVAAEGYSTRRGGFRHYEMVCNCALPVAERTLFPAVIWPETADILFFVIIRKSQIPERVLRLFPFYNIPVIAYLALQYSLEELEHF